MNSSVSIGTEQYSDTSADTQTGGFLSGLFGEKSGYGAEACLRAFNTNAPHIACWLIKDSLNEKLNGKTFELDYSKKDKNNRTLLHHLVYVSSKSPSIVQLLIDVLENTSAKKYINVQDLKGNTCTHYATYSSTQDGKEYMDDVVNLLKNHGANLSIKNKDGIHIELEKIPTSMSPSSIFLTINSDQCENSKRSNKHNETSENKSMDAIESRISDLIKQFVDKSDSTIGFERSEEKSKTLTNNNINNDSDDDDDIIDDSSTSSDSSSSSSSLNNLNSDDVINELLKKINDKDLNEQKSEKPRQEKLRQEKPRQEEPRQEEPKQEEQTGGASKKNNNNKSQISGRRKMSTYSELSFGGSSDDFNDSDESDLSSDDDYNLNINKLARVVNSKASEAHLNSIKKIKEILGLSDEDTKAIKAILYERIKESHPEYSNADKAMELEKMASDKSILKEIKKSEIKNMIETIKKKQLEKSESQSASSSSPIMKRQYSRESSDEYSVVSHDDSSSTSSTESSDSSSDSSMY